MDSYDVVKWDGRIEALRNKACFAEWYRRTNKAALFTVYVPDVPRPNHAPLHKDLLEYVARLQEMGFTLSVQGVPHFFTKWDFYGECVETDVKHWAVDIPTAPYGSRGTLTVMHAVRYLYETNGSNTIIRHFLNLCHEPSDVSLFNRLILCLSGGAHGNVGFLNHMGIGLRLKLIPDKENFESFVLKGNCNISGVTAYPPIPYIYGKESHTSKLWQSVPRPTLAQLYEAYRKDEKAPEGVGCWH